MTTEELTALFEKHDEIYLETELEDLAKVATEDDVKCRSEIRRRVAVLYLRPY